MPARVRQTDKTPVRTLLGPVPREAVRGFHFRCWCGKTRTRLIDELWGRDGAADRLSIDAYQLSIGYCALVRRGERVPHTRHWVGLRNVQP